MADWTTLKFLSPKTVFQPSQEKIANLVRVIRYGLLTGFPNSGFTRILCSLASRRIQFGNHCAKFHGRSCLDVTRSDRSCDGRRWPRVYRISCEGRQALRVGARAVLKWRTTSGLCSPRLREPDIWSKRTLASAADALQEVFNLFGSVVVVGGHTNLNIATLPVFENGNGNAVLVVEPRLKL